MGSELMQVADLTKVIVLVCAVVLSGCSIYPRQDTHYDPDFRQGESLFDQIPNNEVRYNPDGTVVGTCYPKLNCD